ncbi:hypothetical protein J7T55_000113 [Diaporthe amygdali]|uniref:uncharacterized protein n=1 Tax=Phomopsis amygdali TaxID=1214568 RepID=UPI0022FEA8F9|nr:uncharacterized protein J7T55_000113 [Diaporthe amygdali]KAJ0100754.1 hypothetical protein J7T55_000113 [Diaporthe amygdali]
MSQIIGIHGGHYQAQPAANFQTILKHRVEIDKRPPRIVQAMRLSDVVCISTESLVGGCGGLRLAQVSFKEFRTTTNVASLIDITHTSPMAAGSIGAMVLLANAHPFTGSLNHQLTSSTRLYRLQRQHCRRPPSTFQL